MKGSLKANLIHLRSNPSSPRKAERLCRRRSMAALSSSFRYQAFSAEAGRKNQQMAPTTKVTQPSMMKSHLQASKEYEVSNASICREKGPQSATRLQDPFGSP